MVASQLSFINYISEIAQKVSESFGRALSTYIQPLGGWETETSKSPKDNQSNYAN